MRQGIYILQLSLLTLSACGGPSDAGQRKSESPRDENQTSASLGDGSAIGYTKVPLTRQPSPHNAPGCGSQEKGDLAPVGTVVEGMLVGPDKKVRVGHFACTGKSGVDNSISLDPPTAGFSDVKSLGYRAALFTFVESGQRHYGFVSLEVVEHDGKEGWMVACRSSVDRVRLNGSAMISARSADYLPGGRGFCGGSTGEPGAFLAGVDDPTRVVVLLGGELVQVELDEVGF